MMGGDVTVASEHGKGSVFTVRLPGGERTKRPDVRPVRSISYRPPPTLIAGADEVIDDA